MEENLAAILEGARDEAGDAVALDVDGVCLTYRDLVHRVGRAAAALHAEGVEAGDRVVLRLPNGSAFVEAYFGALRLGAIVVPLNPLLSEPEAQERIAACEPAFVVDAPLETPLKTDAPVPALVSRSGADPAVILFTSGTSGAPKGAVLTHGSLRAAADNARDALELTASDVVLGAAPFSHVLGQSAGLIATFLARGAVAVVERFAAAATLETMRRTGTTVFLGVPTMCILLLEEAHEAGSLPPLRLAHVGGAPLAPEAADEFEQVFRAGVAEGYGLTELSGIGTTFARGRPRKGGSVGAPLGDTELRIVDDRGNPLPTGEPGEVQFRGASVIPGYWHNAAATAGAISADGWLATGDIGRVDADGDLYLVGRKKEMIIRGGYNVFPREVEEALGAHPDVVEVAVVGVPHATLGEEIAAAVVARTGSGLTVDDLRAYARERLAAYKYPRLIVLVDQLPHGPSGKVLKRAIDVEALMQHPGAPGTR
jgi:long-chain acyl-CoA synthetase